jgi:UDP-N-acetylglucosamine 4,6-dehydratase
MDWTGLTVLLTGGTGSFGRKFAEIILQEHDLKKLIIFSRDELKQHEMRGTFNDPRLRYFIGDIRDKERLHRAVHDVDVIVHAAALKQVPSCEYNPFEAVKTNILGASNIINVAIDASVKKVMALSTDKAVNPINLYGATKLVAEKLFVQGNAYAGARGTRFSCVRYGNVVGSRGSVRFVIRCMGLMRGGEVFVPKIPSMRLVDLAEVVAPECEREVIGIRPGEKLHEVLVSRDESRYTLEFDDMYLIQPVHPWWETKQYPGAQPMEEGTKFSSDGNSWWLSRDDLCRIIEE